MALPRATRRAMRTVLGRTYPSCSASSPPGPPPGTMASILRCMASICFWASGESGSASSSSSLASSTTGRGRYRTLVCCMPWSAAAATSSSWPAWESLAVQPCHSRCLTLPLLTSVGVRVTSSMVPRPVRSTSPSCGARHWGVSMLRQWRSCAVASVTFQASGRASISELTSAKAILCPLSPPYTSSASSGVISRQGPPASVHIMRCAICVIPAAAQRRARPSASRVSLPAHCEPWLRCTLPASCCRTTSSHAQGAVLGCI